MINSESDKEDKIVQVFVKEEEKQEEKTFEQLFATDSVSSGSLNLINLYLLIYLGLKKYFYWFFN